ncbi:hypothetical protein B0H11DRAFT_1238230 [Mycena galericulata]|nr:hypothetical protein B0H11DRAFT_1238230 [Mycena galericulata]
MGELSETPVLLRFDTGWQYMVLYNIRKEGNKPRILNALPVASRVFSYVFLPFHRHHINRPRQALSLFILYHHGHKSHSPFAHPHPHTRSRPPKVDAPSRPSPPYSRPCPAAAPCACLRCRTPSPLPRRCRHAPLSFAFHPSAVLIPQPVHSQACSPHCTAPTPRFLWSPTAPALCASPQHAQLSLRQGQLAQQRQLRIWRRLRPCRYRRVRDPRIIRAAGRTGALAVLHPQDRRRRGWEGLGEWQAEGSAGRERARCLRAENRLRCSCARRFLARLAAGGLALATT